MDEIERSVADYLGKSPIPWDHLKQAICFVVLWNRLEVMHQNHLSLVKLQKSSGEIVSKDSGTIGGYQSHIQFFRTKSNGQNLMEMNPFYHHQTKREEIEEKVGRLLENCESLSCEDMLAALMYFPYRLRNNLFHGLKNPADIADQQDVFRECNEVLVRFMSDLQLARSS